MTTNTKTRINRAVPATAKKAPMRKTWTQLGLKYEQRSQEELARITQCDEHGTKYNDSASVFTSSTHEAVVRFMNVLLAADSQGKKSDLTLEVDPYDTSLWSLGVEYRLGDTDEECELTLQFPRDEVKRNSITNLFWAFKKGTTKKKPAPRLPAAQRADVFKDAGTWPSMGKTAAKPESKFGPVQLHWPHLNLRIVETAEDKVPFLENTDAGLGRLALASTKPEIQMFCMVANKAKSSSTECTLHSAPDVWTLTLTVFENSGGDSGRAFFRLKFDATHVNTTRETFEAVFSRFPIAINMPKNEVKKMSKHAASKTKSWEKPKIQATPFTRTATTMRFDFSGTFVILARTPFANVVDFCDNLDMAMRNVADEVDLDAVDPLILRLSREEINGVDCSVLDQFFSETIEEDDSQPVRRLAFAYDRSLADVFAEVFDNYDYLLDPSHDTRHGTTKTATDSRLFKDVGIIVHNDPAVENTRMEFPLGGDGKGTFEAFADQKYQDVVDFMNEIHQAEDGRATKANREDYWVIRLSYLPGTRPISQLSIGNLADEELAEHLTFPYEPRLGKVLRRVFLDHNFKIVNGHGVGLSDGAEAISASRAESTGAYARRTPKYPVKDGVYVDDLLSAERDKMGLVEVTMMPEDVLNVEKQPVFEDWAHVKDFFIKLDTFLFGSANIRKGSAFFLRAPIRYTPAPQHSLPIKCAQLVLETKTETLKLTFPYNARVVDSLRLTFKQHVLVDQSTVEPAKAPKRSAEDSEDELEASVQPGQGYSTFAEKYEMISQYREGRLTEEELMFGLQMTRFQVEAFHDWNKMPARVKDQTSLSEWDEMIEQREQERRAN